MKPPQTESETGAVINYGECGDKTMEGEIWVNLGLLRSDNFSTLEFTTHLIMVLQLEKRKL